MGDYALGWGILSLVLLAVIVFCSILIRTYREPSQANTGTTVAAIAGLSVALIALISVPVDVYFGEFHSNSSSSRLNRAEMSYLLHEQFWSCLLADAEPTSGVQCRQDSMETK